MRVLVAGGAGFIGSHLVDRLMEEGYKVRVVDNLSAGRLKNLSRWLEDARFEFLEGDLRDFGVASRAVNGVDAVFHLAANPEVRIGSQKPGEIYENNVGVTYNLLEAMRRHGVKRLVFASSSTVYGEAKKIPTPEDYSPLEPISIYGASKLACEALISGYAHTFKIRSLVLRLANIVGERSNHGVIYDFILKLKKNPKILEILGDGNQRKSYLHVSDCIEATLHLYEKFERDEVLYDVYNIGSEDWVLVREIADIVVEELGLENVKYMFTGGVNGGRGWPGDVKIMLLDIRKAKNKGWKPRLNSKQAVKRAAQDLINSLNF
ncbi:MAG: NAD-dependent epimerase/dehydratase family protein [Candidatus Njordarchaeales archaeon]